MVKSLTQISLFVSSPGGLEEDRASVASAIAEANKILGLDGLQISPFFWEQDSLPGRGTGDAQSIINRELIENTDLLVILMHSRVGSATKNSISGTIEEFDIFNRAINGGKIGDICVYFCVSPVSPLTDAVQLGLVQEFRRRIQGLAYLTRDYEAAIDLRHVLISHLVTKARNLSGSEVAEAVVAPTAFQRLVEESIIETQDDLEVEGLGPLDYEAIAVETINNSTKSLNEIASFLSEYNYSLEAQTQKISLIQDRVRLGLNIDRKAIFDEFGDHLSEHIDKIGPAILRADADMSTGTSATLSLVQEWPLETASERKTIEDLVPSMEGSASITEVLREEVSKSIANMQSIPGMTQKTKKAKSRAIRTYSTLIDSLDRNASTLRASINLAKQRLGWE